jgi:NTP pyrophosphatase (non-canonical NTP hydrolase)
MNTQAAAGMIYRVPPDGSLFTLDNYQRILEAVDTPGLESPADSGDGRYHLWYYILGLVGESGEAADKILALYKRQGVAGRLWQRVLSVAAQASMTVDAIKKMYRNQGYGKNESAYGPYEMTDDERREFAKELGDVLWYVARAAARIDMPLSEVARLNIEKLSDRAARGVVRSQGDNR